MCSELTKEKIKSKSCLGRALRGVFNEYLFGDITEIELKKILKEYVHKYERMIFTEGKVNKTIMNIIGVKRAEYINKLNSEE